MVTHGGTAVARGLGRVPKVSPGAVVPVAVPAVHIRQAAPTILGKQHPHTVSTHQGEKRARIEWEVHVSPCTGG